MLALAAGVSCWSQPQARRSDHAARTASALDAAAFSSFDSLEQACLSLPAHGCDVITTAPHVWVLSGAHPVPRTLHVHFTGKGQWHILGGTLDFQAATIDAPAHTQVFDGGGVQGLAEARPEWFSLPVEGVYPPQALAAAYRATVEHGTILLSTASYMSPFSSVPSNGQAPDSFIPFNSERLLLGTKRPVPDSETNPTHLQDGTILLGELRGNAALRAANLGIDNGPEVVSRYFHGVESYGLVLGSVRKLGVVGGTRLENIAVLANGMHDQHAVIVEGQFDTTINHLWIWTPGGTHGLVIKSSSVTVHDFHCAGAADDCLIVKSDFATSRFGYAEHVDISDVDIHSLAHPGDTAGIIVDSRWDSVHSLTLRNIHQQGTTFGIIALGSIFHTLYDLHIENWTASGLSGPCLLTRHMQGMDVSHFDCAVRASLDPAAIQLKGADIRIHDGVIRCVDTLATCAAGQTNGVDNMSRSAQITNLRGERLGGYLLRTTARSANTSTDSFTTLDMQQRLSTPYKKPHLTLRQRGTKVMEELKPTLRIVWTWIDTRIIFHPMMCVVLAFILVSGLLLILATQITKRHKLT